MNEYWSEYMLFRVIERMDNAKDVDKGFLNKIIKSWQRQGFRVVNFRLSLARPAFSSITKTGESSHSFLLCPANVIKCSSLCVFSMSPKRRTEARVAAPVSEGETKRRRVKWPVCITHRVDCKYSQSSVFLQIPRLL